MGKIATDNFVKAGKRRYRFAYLLAAFVYLFFYGNTDSLSFGDDSNIKTAVILTSRIRPYLDALEGFQKEFKADVDVFDISSNPELPKHMLLSGSYNLAVAIGPKATELVWGLNLPSLKRISCMVLDMENHTYGSKGCGVELRIPVKEQLEAIKSNISGLGNTGILYNPEENSEIVDSAMECASDMQINVVPMPVESPDQIIPLFSRMVTSHTIDSLLFIPDSTVTSSRALIRHIIKTAVLKRIAVVGYNSFFMNTGAVLSFIIDYRETGYITGQMAVKLISNENECTVTPPPFSIEWNQSVLKKLFIPLSSAATDETNIKKGNGETGGAL